jgi:branched-chain amino acid transport system permease protein
VTQVLVQAAVTAAIGGTLAVSFGLMHSGGRFFDMTHGIAVLVGAYIANWTLPRGPGTAVLLGVLGGMAAKALGEVGVTRRIRHRSVGPGRLFLASLGLLVVAQNAASLLFSDRPRLLELIAAGDAFHLLGAHISRLDVVVFVSLGVVVSVLAATWQLSRRGLVARAVVSQYDLALAYGAPAHNVSIAIVSLGAGLAALAGMAWAAEYDLRPAIGLQTTLVGAAGYILAGVKRPFHAFFGGCVVAVVQQVAVMVAPSVWQEAITYGVLLGVLVLRPAGLFGLPQHAVRL